MTDKLTYGITVNSLPCFTMVYLANKRVGMIIESSEGFRYSPDGHERGDLFQTLAECKQSLEPNND